MSPLGDNHFDSLMNTFRTILYCYIQKYRHMLWCSENYLKVTPESHSRLTRPWSSWNGGFPFPSRSGCSQVLLPVRLSFHLWHRGYNIPWTARSPDVRQFTFSHKPYTEVLFKSRLLGQVTNVFSHWPDCFVIPAPQKDSISMSMSC